MTALQTYGMDVGFFSHTGAYPLETRCAMLADLGYDATNLTLWSEPAWTDLRSLWQVADRHGLAVASIYLTIDLSLPLDHPESRRALDAISSAGETPTEITLRYSGEEHAPSKPSGDAAALAFLEQAINRATAAGGSLRLYPHFSFWMERVDDVLRLLEQLPHHALRMTFPAFHVYALEGSGFGAALDRARPVIAGVNTNGSRRLAGQYFPVTIEPVGDGDFDNFAFLGRLRSFGYSGSLGVQAYGVGGDAYTHFARSRAALREIEARLDAHPEWAQLRPDTL
ncbi:sugar phosphate isomerase/epimerase family protein [Promicromonospora sp. Populi]|uniref:sugar phosphate isomerase/epimerase family protein n=1 Tax=Promicromonospora sp. Populi TaxID=3239420 RepID=UPI0034E298ED